MLCTHWHDARTAFNSSLRKLQQKWSDTATLCCFDDNIGFSKDAPDPETGEQISIRYCKNEYGNTEVIDGITYGWHPTRTAGKGEYIQQKLASIFVDEVKRNYPELIK